MNHYLNELMTKLANFVVIWQFFRLLFGHK